MKDEKEKVKVKDSMPIGGGQTDPPLRPAGISQGLLTVQVMAFCKISDHNKDV